MDFGGPTIGQEGGKLIPVKIITNTYPTTCSIPQGIECRAKNYPGLPVSKLGQEVKCNLKDGLVCLNKNQNITQQCFDYEMRLLCCHRDCVGASLPAALNRALHNSSTRWSDWMDFGSPTTGPEGGEIVPIKTITNTFVNTCSAPTEVECHAKLFPGLLLSQLGQHNYYHTNTFKPESEIYNKTDGDGWCYIAKCVKTEEKKCDVIKLSQPCLTTILPSGHNCDGYMPPLTNGVSILVGNCYIDTCINGTIEHKPVQCDPVEHPVCDNKFPPIKVPDESGCCFKYECQCVCSGFLNLHYVTFDGKYYPFQGNSTYVLVQEIYTTYNFSAIVVNICDFEESISCPKALKVHYKSSEIIMTQRFSGGSVMNLIYVNHKEVKLPFQIKDISATENGKESLVVISEIGAQISFNGTMFSINLPWQKFHGNTEGHCGICDNNHKNDCRLPNGTIISSCQEMAPYWNVHNNNNNNKNNNNKTLLSPRHRSISVPCPSSAICKIFERKLFEKCHKFVPYEPYVSACNIDVCNMNNETVGCARLEAYAKKCAMAGVCVDWRDATNGMCDFKCKMPQIYLACGPQVEPTCDGRFNLNNNAIKDNALSNFKSMQREGCYCPSGTTLLRHKSNVCVPSCGYKDVTTFGYEKLGAAA
ncbi:mucin-5AC [Pimephales promelas]|nr:mucin-5AC [Pimephales promelas]